MTHGDIEDADITKVTAFIKDMTEIGVLVPDDILQLYPRQKRHMQWRCYRWQHGNMPVKRYGE